MDFNEARTIINSSGHVRIFRLSGESLWRCIYNEISADHLRDARSGHAETTRVYACNVFLDIFCDKAGLLARPASDEIVLIPFESLSISASLLESSIVLWSDSADPILIEQRPVRASTSITHPLQPGIQHAYLDSLSFDFGDSLKLPCGNPAPPHVKNWQYSLARKQLTADQVAFCEAIADAFSRPSSVVRPVSLRYVRNILATLRKLWGIAMNHIGFTEMQTRSLRILDPELIAYYFRFLANASEGRDGTASTLELERQTMKHLLDALKTQVIRNDSGLREDDLKYGLTLDDVAYFLDNHVCRALKWVPHKGKRKAERLDLDVIPNSSVLRWQERVQREAQGLMESWGLHTRKTEGLAIAIQDSFVMCMLGGLYPPQRAEVLQTISAPPADGEGPVHCTVPGCRNPSCKGNYVKIHSAEGADSFDSFDEHQVPAPVPEYSIEVGHMKNNSGIRAGKTGVTVHSPVDLGPTVQWLLHMMLSWSSALLRDLHAPNSNHRRLLVDYRHGDLYLGSIDDEDHQKRFAQYVQLLASPEVPVPPCTFRFLFVRRVEIALSEACETQNEAESHRSEMARQMCTSLDEWKKTYALPAPSLPQPGHRRARELVFGDA